MASIAIGLPNNSICVGQRKISPKMEMISEKFQRIATVLFNNISDNFLKIAEATPDKNNEEVLIVAIQAKQMEPLVKASIAEIESEADSNRDDLAVAAKFASDFFIKNLQISLSEEDFDREDLESASEDLSEKWFEKVYRGAHLAFTQLFAEKAIPLPRNLQDASCYDYALYTIGDQRAVNANFSDDELPAYLEEWGYRVVEKPLPGDLVLFLNEGIPTHLGVCREKGLIESKWGNGHRMAYLHTLENAPAAYGSQVIYYRPPKQK